MPLPQRKPSETAQQVVPLLLLGMGLVSSNPSAVILGDEAQTLSLAAQPVRVILERFSSTSHAPFSYPPLFDIFLHFWLRLTGGNFTYLRIPSILFFLAGLFLLGRASRQLTGTKGGAAVIWAGALWPYGFHYGRLAVAPVFSFFLVCGLTFAYQKYIEQRNRARWAALLLFCLGLIWTNYFGWAVLACLAVDFLLHPRDAEFSGRLRILAGTFALLCIAFIPLLPAFRAALRAVVDLHHRLLPDLVNAAYCVYSLFVSESVAPWYWRLSIPVGSAVLLCVLLAVRWSPRSARRLLIYSACLIAVMALLGTLNPQRLLLTAPWILLPIGVVIETAKPRWTNVVLAVALLTIGGIGWYGIYARHYYSALQFIEPWQQEAGDVAGKIHSGATVIADDPSFLFYLTYALHIPNEKGPWRYEGSVPQFVHHSQIYSPADWLSSGRPMARTMLLIRGSAEQGVNPPIDMAAKQLDQTCGSISSRLMMRDEGYEWKQRFFSQEAPSRWRIEIRDYDCDSSNSKQIFPAPTH